MTAKTRGAPAVPLFRRLMVANRGEVAVRIARACDLLGITPVFAFSTADRDAPYLRGRESVCIGPARAPQSYLNMQAIVQAARQRECTALHPGWASCRKTRSSPPCARPTASPS